MPTPLKRCLVAHNLEERCAAAESATNRHFQSCQNREGAINAQSVDSEYGDDDAESKLGLEGE
jgi:hypothetical protein